MIFALMSQSQCMKTSKCVVIAFICMLLQFGSYSQSVNYPYQVSYIHLKIKQQDVRMAYMDVRPNQPNGKTVVLLHGKNFNGYYWKDIITALSAKGYRVIVPDQVGWGYSDKPDIHYSFHLLAFNTKQLLDTLGISNIYLVGHSMGGMLAARFTLMYPDAVRKLVFENPIGLEDYKTFIPYRPTDSQFASEMKANWQSLKAYQQSYYPEWKPQYDQYVTAQYEALQHPDFRQATWASALTYQMIYEQPVVYEFKDIRCPTLVIIGQADRTVVGKNLLAKAQATQHGNYPVLGERLHQQIKGSTLIPFPGVGHIPHIQQPDLFLQQLIRFFD